MEKYVSLIDLNNSQLAIAYNQAEDELQRTKAYFKRLEAKLKPLTKDKNASYGDLDYYVKIAKVSKALNNINL